MTRVVQRIVGIVVFALLPHAAFGQAGEIAGLVKDTTGAVLPGVTVEAASPALIEKVRTVVTDEQGVYRIIDLRPGLYTVTFSLTGFATVKRDGIQLSAGFTAPVNIEMKVGELKETITVSGASPIIDTQTVAKRQVIGDDVVEALPTAKTWQTLGNTVVGVQMAVNPGSTPDVGGSGAEAAVNISIHGSGQVRIQLNGFNEGNTASSTALATNDAAVQEVSYELSAISLEVATGGIRVNLIPKEGSNHFSGMLFGNYAGRRMNSSNFTQELKNRGALAPDRVNKIPDESFSLGGPVKQDRLWFFYAHRYGGRWLQMGDIYFSKDPNAFFYNADFSRPGIKDTWDLDNQLRLTWQVSPKNKVGLFYDDHRRCHCHNLFASNIAAEAGLKQGTPYLYMTHATWTSTVTNKLLLEAGSNIYGAAYTSEPSNGFTNFSAYSVLDNSTGRRLVAPAPPFSGTDQYNWHTRVVANYVTGSHALTTGLTFIRGRNSSQNYSTSNDTSLVVLNGVPQSVVVYTTPYKTDQQLNAGLGLFVQDRWTIRRLTLDYGLRFDYLNWQVMAQSAPPGTWVGARSFDPVYDVPNWKDLNPRVGVAYDLFGNGKTAVRATASRYVSVEGVAITSAVNPITTTVNSATRTWTDLNGDHLPQESELGPLSNSNFGQVVVTTRYDDSVREGWFKRPSEWEYSASIQHQLAAQVSSEVGYYRRTSGNFTVTENLAVTPADYDPYCITAPINSQLPGGGGYPVCGLYNVKPAKFGQASNQLVVFNDAQKRIYNGVDFSMRAKMPRLYISGGVSLGSILSEDCKVFDNPQKQFCKSSTGWLPTVNVSASYTLPWWNVSAGAAFISFPGPAITATYNVPSALIQPSLGRPLSAGAGATAAVSLVEPGTMYGDRRNQLDLRLSKQFPINSHRQLELMADLYNALNVSPVTEQNNTYGPQWQRPTGILLGRIAKVGARFKF
jgi:hypothetical protein